MKKEDLETGKNLESRIENIESKIKQLKNENETRHIEIAVTDHGSLVVKNNSSYSEKANIILEHFNQLYRDNILRTLEDCKDELEKEFELLGE